MNNANADPLAWLAKAKRDLDSTTKLAEGDNPYLDTAIYHLQQAGEKAVKGFLVWRDQPFEKIHDVRLLMMQAAKTNAAFNERREVAALLTPYATEFRYPDDLSPAKKNLTKRCAQQISVTTLFCPNSPKRFIRD